jgi:dTDP-4-dehydrorhamnose reductase
VNSQGAGNLARAAAAAGAALVHVSTDYVFPGDAPLDAAGRARPYLESDATGPRSVYGRTKLEGEREVLTASNRHTVVRSAWLFGLGGSNFVATMLRLAGEQDPAGGNVRVVSDQIGSPTWCGHLAPAVVGLVEREVAGVVHLAGAGAVSWHGFAVEIFRQAGVACHVHEASSEEMARPAPRPAWSALASERDDVLPMPDWRDGLAGYLAARAGMTR